MPEMRKLLVFVLSIVAGGLLIISGPQGPVASYETIIQKLSLFIKDTVIISIATATAGVLIALSSFGGLIVIVGGYLVYSKHVSTGKLMIGFGGGAGIPLLLLMLWTIVSTQDLSTVMAQHSATGWTGIVLSLIARTVAK